MPQHEYGNPDREGAPPERKHLGQPQPAERADKTLQGEHEQLEEQDDQLGPAVNSSGMI